MACGLWILYGLLQCDDMLRTVQLHKPSTLLWWLVFHSSAPTVPIAYSDSTSVVQGASTALLWIAESPQPSLAHVHYYLPDSAVFTVTEDLLWWYILPDLIFIFEDLQHVLQDCNCHCDLKYLSSLFSCVSLRGFLPSFLVFTIQSIFLQLPQHSVGGGLSKHTPLSAPFWGGGLSDLTPLHSHSQSHHHHSISTSTSATTQLLTLNGGDL